MADSALPLPKTEITRLRLVGESLGGLTETMRNLCDQAEVALTLERRCRELEAALRDDLPESAARSEAINTANSSSQVPIPAAGNAPTPRTDSEEFVAYQHSGDDLSKCVCVFSSNGYALVHLNGAPLTQEEQKSYEHD